jgi:hypothetical protein
VKNDFTEGSEDGTYSRLDTSRIEGTWDGPPGREAQGHGARVVVVSVTPHQGGREDRPQGEDWQVLGADRKGGVRNGCGQNWMAAHRLTESKHWRATCLETYMRRSEEGRGKRAV